ncbi:hypothetical protein [Candidatus Poriferisodalis sp.]|uniref:hypothetical protein n=1 Tax=Candidatus Poriferisodalis sp. TaxID=3101277 RepID=UPI003B01E2E5
MLTALQQRVRSIVAELPEAGTVALAGGGALIVHGIDEMSIDIGISDQAKPRDFVDIHALAGRFELADLYRFAAEKDPGFGLEHLRDALGVFDHHPRQAFPVTDSEYEGLRDWVHDWRIELPANEERLRSADEHPRTSRDVGDLHSLTPPRRFDSTIPRHCDA